MKYNSCYPVEFLLFGEAFPLLCLPSEIVHYFWKAAVDTASRLSFILSWENFTSPQALRSVTVKAWCKKKQKKSKSSWSERFQSAQTLAMAGYQLQHNVIQSSSQTAWSP